MSAYYNEFDPFAAAWLRELIKAGHIADGVVDERSIVDVQPSELSEFTQCHFFAGIGAWSYALRLAGWADDRPVWTGSPPCQPFSVAGQQRGVKDDRHLAPHFLELVKARRPTVLFGEQVAAAVKKDNWLDDLLDELEREDYTTGAAVLPSCGIGSPNIRSRLWFVAESIREGLQGRVSGRQDTQREDQHGHLGCDRPVSRMADTEHNGSPITEKRGDNPQTGQRGQEGQTVTVQPSGNGRSESNQDLYGATGESSGEPTSAVDNFWDNSDWLFCRDGKWRPVESGTLPLVNGTPNRVGRVRGYGNAINPWVAKEVIEIYIQC